MRCPACAGGLCPNCAQKAEAAGVRAIIYLQSLVGIKEPEERARANWRAMSDASRAKTILFANLQRAGNN